MASVLGVEIGSDSIKIAVCSSGKVKQLICERLPENMVSEGRIAIADAMSEFLKELRKKYKLPTTKVKLVLPTQAVLTKTFNMPVMSDEELRLNLPFEFKAYMGENRGGKVQYTYDYAVLEHREAEADRPAQLELFAAAVSVPFVEEYREVFKKAGFKLICGMPKEIALQNLVRAGVNVPSELAIVDLGHSKTSVDIFSNGVYSMGKIIEVGGQALDTIIAEINQVDEHASRIQKETNLENCQSQERCIDIYNHIAYESRKVVNFYGYSTHSDGLRDVYFCGGCSNIENLKLKIVKDTNLTPHNVGKLFGKEEDDPVNSAFCALAVGAGIQPDKEEAPAKTSAKKTVKEELSNG